MRDSGAEKRRAKRILRERVGRSADPELTRATEIAIDALNESIGKSIYLSRWRRWAESDEGGEHGKG